MLYNNLKMREVSNSYYWDSLVTLIIKWIAQLTFAVRLDSDVEKLRYFVGQMDIRNKNPHLFRAFGFRLLVEKCSVRATKSHTFIHIHIYIYARACVCVCARIDPFLLDYSFHAHFSYAIRVLSWDRWFPIASRMALSIGRVIIRENVITYAFFPYFHLFSNIS